MQPTCRSHQHNNSNCRLSSHLAEEEVHQPVGDLLAVNLRGDHQQEDPLPVEVVALQEEHPKEESHHR